MLFLTMHGIDSDHRTGQRKRAEQSLDRRDFIGLFVAVEMRQHQSRVRSEGAKEPLNKSVSTRLRDDLYGSGRNDRAG